MLLRWARIRLFIQLMTILGLFRIISAVQYEHCGQDFVSLGRHVWRCKARKTSSARPPQAVDTPPVVPPALSNSSSANSPFLLPLPHPGEPEDDICPCRHMTSSDATSSPCRSLQGEERLEGASTGLRFLQESSRWRAFSTPPTSIRTHPLLYQWTVPLPSRLPHPHRVTGQSSRA